MYTRQTVTTSFHVKWGGTPPNMETFTDPCLQGKISHSPITSTRQMRLKIQNYQKKHSCMSGTKEEAYLQHQLTKRIKTYESPKKSFYRLWTKRRPQPNTRDRKRRRDERGRNQNTTQSTNTAPQAAAAQAQAPAPQTPINKAIFKLKTSIFGDTVVKNRRLTPKEYEDELIVAKAFCRPPRNYIYDPPFYPWLPPAPIVPFVNFSLNFKD